DLGGGTTSPFIHGASFGLPSQCFTNAKQPFTVTGVTPPFGCFGTLGRDRFNTPGFAEVDLRVSKGINFGERFRVDLIADVFNLAHPPQPRWGAPARHSLGGQPLPRRTTQRRFRRPPVPVRPQAELVGSNVAARLQPGILLSPKSLHAIRRVGIFLPAIG